MDSIVQVRIEAYLLLKVEANIGFGPLEGQMKRSYAFEDRASELSRSAFMMRLASAGAYEPSKNWGIRFEMLDWRLKDIECY